MNADVVALPVPRSPGRHGTLRLVATLAAYGLRSFVRSPVAAFFTVGLPLLFLVIIGAQCPGGAVAHQRPAGLVGLHLRRVRRRWRDACLARPGWLVLPAQALANALSDAFNPYLPGNGFALDHLAALAAWGLAGALVAVRWFAWEPRPTSRRPRARPRLRDAAARCAS
jgi:hypothetical protein